MLDPEHSRSLVRLARHPRWSDRACARTDIAGQPLNEPDLWTSDSTGDQVDAAWICDHACPLRQACLAHALGGDGWWEPEGIWGGTTPAQRRAIRNQAVKDRARARAAAARPLAPPDPVLRLTETQERVIGTLRIHRDYREAAAALDIPYSNLRWTLSAVCRKVGCHIEGMSVPALLVEVDRAAAREPMVVAA